MAIPSACWGRMTPRRAASSAPSCRARSRSRSCGAPIAPSSARLERERARACSRAPWPTRALSAAHHVAGRGAGDRRSLFLRPAAGRPRPASVQRRPPFRAGRGARRQRRRPSTACTGVRFAVWAPNAERVAVVGDFNAWDARRHPMRLRYPRRHLGAVRAARRRRARATSTTSSARAACALPQKADPVAQQTEPPPAPPRSSPRREPFRWNDDAWMASRAAAPGAATRRSRSTRSISARGCSRATTSTARCGTSRSTG